MPANTPMLLSLCIFLIGSIGLFLNSQNLLKMLLSLELMLVAVTINFITPHHHGGASEGQVYTLIILCVGAAEAAIGLAILHLYYRNYRSISTEDARNMRG